MAKFIKIYEDGEIKETLTFRGLAFKSGMGKDDPEGPRKGGKCYEDLIEAAFPEEAEDGDLDEALEAADKLNFGSDDEIEEALEVLSDYE